jgi:hypothetical protein
VRILERISVKHLMLMKYSRTVEKLKRDGDEVKKITDLPERECEPLRVPLAMLCRLAGSLLIRIAATSFSILDISLRIFLASTSMALIKVSTFLSNICQHIKLQYCFRLSYDSP